MTIQPETTEPTFTLFYATNRNHIGADQWKPDSYGYKFSDDGQENLRFGKVKVTADSKEIDDLDDLNGAKLAECFTKYAKRTSEITAYEERIVTKDNKGEWQRDTHPIYGSKKFLADLRGAVGVDKNIGHILIYIHGYNTDWEEAVGNALALQWMQNHTHERTRPENERKANVKVVLFSWPSDGSKTPYLAYGSDRSDARGSGYAFGRGMLKLRDYMHDLKQDCGCKLHLLCHSMGNYLLEKSLRRFDTHLNRKLWPQIFDQIFLCAADVGSTTFEKGEPLDNLYKMGEEVSVYYNQNDTAMRLSRNTKLNSKRLGRRGANRSNKLQDNVQQIDCQHVTSSKGFEHSYYLGRLTSLDIRQSIGGIPTDDARRNRASFRYKNTCTLYPETNTPTQSYK